MLGISDCAKSSRRIAVRLRCVPCAACTPQSRKQKMCQHPLGFLSFGLQPFEIFHFPAKLNPGCDYLTVTVCNGSVSSVADFNFVANRETMRETIIGFARADRRQWVLGMCTMKILIKLWTAEMQMRTALWDAYTQTA